MTRSDILSAITDIAQRHLERGEELSPEMRLVEDLRLDSIALLTLAIEVENHFRLRLDEEGVAGIQTVGELVETIEAALAVEGGEPT